MLDIQPMKYRPIALILFFLGFGFVSGSQPQKDELWQDLNEAAAASTQNLPQAFRLLKLNRSSLDRILQRATENETSLTLPLPGGGWSTFRIVESPVMAPQLAQKFPEIRTFAGYGVDDPTATLRADVTPVGFHAQVISAAASYYIDPVAATESENYISYSKGDLIRQRTTECHIDLMKGNAEPDELTKPIPSVVPANGQTLRTYRLAFAATGEYTIAAGGTVPLAMARIVTSLNRINGIYERELAIRMTLVANNNLLIYTDPATDPYTNTDVTAMMAQNQTNLDQVIGSGNYDMGHVFGTSGGGTARVRSTCNATFKGQGATGLPNPTGDPFDVDFVAHEMGHQHGGLHTFNTNSGSCSGFRNMISAFEPASGSTPMSYVGTCAPSNLQRNANDYFHVRSLEEMVAHITGAGNCAGQTATGNSPPTVAAGPTFNIPRSTPFTLTASGSDPDGNSLTYNWEEYDLGPVSPPEGDSDGNARPIFRSYPPITSPSRTFPSLQYILVNANVPPATYDCGFPNPCLIGESLPTITRTMSFQVTARDNCSGGGGIVSAATQVNISGAAGPFRITQPETAVTWNTGSLQTVSWDVAGTTAAPISTSQVNILLSTDGGMTFPTVLAANTSNDGNELISVPSLSTNTGRIKVEAVGNIYFDISGINFTIAQAPLPSVQLSSSTYSAGEDATGITLTVTRTGSTSGASSVDFATSDSAGTAGCNVAGGLASSRCDYLISIGTINFAAGETSKTITVPIVDDAYAEGSETFAVTLSNPVGAVPGSPTAATNTITDNEAINGPNPIDLSNFFVRQHYLDFLNREPDPSGFAFWTSEIENCSPKPQCTDVKRINVSAAFFLSIEFRQTGYLVERIYKSAYGDATGSSTLGGVHQLSVPMVRFNEFLVDTQAIGKGVVVNQAGWEQVLENNKQAFLNAFVQRSRFTTAFPVSMSAAQFVDTLNMSAGNPLSTSERNELVTELSSGVRTRAQVLRAVAEDPDLNNAEFNRAFVLLQYFGYLRRNPNDSPDSDYTGYEFWLTKLNQFNGDFVGAEMVKAFILSSEYRRRFGP